jgi:hypothetical protein
MKNKNIILISIGAGLAVAAAALFFWKRDFSGKQEKPSKKAPQLNIENPGDQSEFTTSASETEVG